MTPRPVPVLTACCLLVATVASVSGVAAAQVTVVSLSYGGSDAVGTPDRGLSIWQSDDHEFAVRLAVNESHETSICLAANASGGPRRLGCQNASLAAGETRSLTVDIGPWPANLTGERLVTATVSDRESGETLAGRSMGVTVLGRVADIDGDGLVNEEEVEAGTDLRNPDTDNDTVSDALEVRVYGTSPTDSDSDADGLADGLEIKRYHTDPLDADTDDDGLADGREVDLGTNPSLADSDGDGLVDGPEVNTYQTDPASVDTDDDGLGDGTEVELGTNPTRADTDGDGLTDGQEVTLYNTDPTRADTDGDGLEDATEISEYDTDPTEADSDGDGLDDGDELREYGTDPLVADTDRDGLDDGLELELGSNPTDATSTADPGPLTSARVAVEERPFVAGLVGAAVVLVVAGALAWRFTDRLSAGRVSRTLGGLRESGSVGDDTDDTADIGTLDDGTRPVDGPAGSDAGQTASEGVAGAGTTGAGTGAESVEDLPDDAVLTNEERVARLLDGNGGRMLQSDMVEAADWSKATVSRVLTRMEEAGEITRVDIGRGNLVARPGDEPASTGSPFSESDGS